MRENLIIKGNNLLALHSLKSQFAGKVKLIYIDPPFNTGSDGSYNDSFKRSTWLVFMKNRLEAAKQLLRSDGVIFVQCDDNEQAYLKVLMDEVFGQNNFFSCVAVESSTPSGVKTSHANKKILKSKDYLLVFKNGALEIKPQYALKEKWDNHYSYFIEKDGSDITVKSLVAKIKEVGEFSIKNISEFDMRNKAHRSFYLNYGDFICCDTSHKNKDIKDQCRKHPDKILEIDGNWYRNKRMFQPISRSFHMVFKGHQLVEDASTLICDIWDDVDFNNTQNQGGVSFPRAKKPEMLLFRIIDMVTQPGDIVLDYHLGSGTTAAVAHKMGRQYIGIEQLDYIESIAVARLKNVLAGEQGGISKAVDWQGGGSFVYCELAPWNEAAKAKINACKKPEELQTLFAELNEKYFLDYNLNVGKFQEDMTKPGFKKLGLDRQKGIFCDMLDLNQLYVARSEAGDKHYGISKADQTLTQKFYNEEE